jgi:biopolymer transport protein ExbD
MAIESKNKVDANFSLSSMTDVIFLLLIFFMLTSSAVTPSGVPISQPSSKSAKIEIQKVNVTITKDLRYFVNGTLTPKNELENQLRVALGTGVEKEGAVILYIDKAVATEHLVEVAGMANALNAKVTIATKPEN